MSLPRGRAAALPATASSPVQRRSPATAANIACCLLALSAVGPAARAQHGEASHPAAGVTATPATCLPGGDGYLRARLSGSIQAELAWGNDGTECSGAVRPTDGGIRMRFSRSIGSSAADPQAGRLVLVFGIAGLREGMHARTVPVNVTVIREGRGQFYSTRGEDKCMLDEVSQQPLVGIPHRSRAYRIVARGFCTEPARAVRGEGAVLLSRFDYAGRVDFDSEEADDGTPPLTQPQRSAP